MLKIKVAIMTQTSTSKETKEQIKPNTYKMN